MLRWKLILTTLPLVILIVLVAVGRDLARIPGLLDFGDVAPIITAVALIIGFMLSGVIADFKESERLPGEMASALETLQDACISTLLVNKDEDVSGLMPSMAQLAQAVESWLLRRVDTKACYKALNDFNQQVIPVIYRAAGMTPATRAQGEINQLRRAIARVEAISRTSFIQAGYALLDVMVGATIVLLLLANYKNAMVEYLIIGFLSFVYIYLVRLIRDLDSPFDYAPAGKVKGAAEVDPAPVLEYRQRLAAILTDLQNKKEGT